MDIDKDIEFHDLVFIDLETTGLDVVTGDSICEIGAYKIRKRKVIEKFHTLIDPCKAIPRQAYLIHKISDDDLKGAPVFEDIAGKLIDFLHGSVVCAYNIKFDIGFLNYHLKAMDYPLINSPAIDILGMAREVLESDKYNLITVAELLKLEYDKQKVHRASEDAFIASMVFFKILKIFREKGLEKLKYFLSLFGFPNDIFLEEQ
ncbi:MAG: hypothetical protein GF375_01040, partial [Candidatus Omnitrophica bacterium]|nr:hypothetical protein [Candidatus Omnitrophota bacterium]MBD3268723.1 hypothetical protein [Candidatus Omnitrophota bacterium]